MKYLCLVYLEEQKLHAVPDSECAACGVGLRSSGLLIAAEALLPIETATTVRVVDVPTPSVPPVVRRPK